jgi:hypothetical protein
LFFKFFLEIKFLIKNCQLLHQVPIKGPCFSFW